MRRALLRVCTVLLIAAFFPGASELVEGALHLAREGHLAHAAPDGDRHEPSDPEHGCTPLFHFCGCHASPASLGPTPVPSLALCASSFDASTKPSALPLGYGLAVERPPRA